MPRIAHVFASGAIITVAPEPRLALTARPHARARSLPLPCSTASCSRAVLNSSQDFTWRWLSRGRLRSRHARSVDDRAAAHVDFIPRDRPVRCPQSAGRQAGRKPWSTKTNRQAKENTRKIQTIIAGTGAPAESSDGRLRLRRDGEAQTVTKNSMQPFPTSWPVDARGGGLLRAGRGLPTPTLSRISSTHIPGSRSDRS